jgi:hypothetical protein
MGIYHPAHYFYGFPDGIGQRPPFDIPQLYADIPAFRSVFDLLDQLIDECEHRIIRLNGKTVVDLFPVLHEVADFLTIGNIVVVFAELLLMLQKIGYGVLLRQAVYPADNGFEPLIFFYIYLGIVHGLFLLKPL